MVKPLGTLYCAWPMGCAHGSRLARSNSESPRGVKLEQRTHRTARDATQGANCELSSWTTVTERQIC